MWDNTRLESEWDLSGEPFEDLGEDTQVPTFSYSEEVAYSYERRSEICEAGGRGWWSKDDASKIEWEDGKAPEWFK